MIRNATSVWFSVLLSLCVGCGSDSSSSKRSPDAARSEDDACPRGTKDCPCTEAGYCDKGLVCRSNVCEKRAAAAQEGVAWSDGDDSSDNGGAPGAPHSENGGRGHSGGVIGSGGFGGRIGIGGAGVGVGGSTGTGGTVVGIGGSTGVGGVVIGVGGSTGTGGSGIGEAGALGTGGSIIGEAGAPGTGGSIIGEAGAPGTGGSIIGAAGAMGTGGSIIAAGAPGTGGSVIGPGGAAGTGGAGTGGAGGVPTCNPSFGSSLACGGDERATWTLVDACTNSSLLQQLQSACEGAVGTDTPTVGGTLVLDGEAFTRTVYIYHSIDLQVPSGNTCLAEGAITCAELAPLLAALDSSLYATCVSDGANGCDCVVTGGTESYGSGAYTANRSSGTLTLNDGERVYDYCVQGDFMTALQSSDAGAEAGIVQLYARQQ